MVYWYIVAHCEWLGPNFGQAEYLDMNGYTEGTMGDQKIEDDAEVGDPFLSYGIDTETWAYGQAQMEIGLIGSHRIRINSSGVRIWTAGDVWKDPLTEGGGAEGEWFKTITGITNDVVADVSDDTLTISSANNRLTIAGNSETDTINFTLVEANINHNALANYAVNRHFLQSEISITESQISDLNHLTEGEISLTNLLEKNHVSLTNKNAEANVKHLTDAQIAALHAIVVAGDLNHNDLANLNAGDSYEHITATQLAALHAKQHAMDDAAEHTSSDIATLNSSITKHGFLKKLDNVAINYMDGQGNWSVPAGEGGADKTRSIKMELRANMGATNVDYGILIDATTEGYTMSIKLPANIDATKDIKIIYTFRSDYTGVMYLLRWVAAIKTDNSEALTWNIVSSEGFWPGPYTATKTGTETYTIAAANIQAGDTIMMLVRSAAAYSDRLIYNAYLEYEVN